MPLQKMLDLSTGHITSKDAELLRRYKSEGNDSAMALTCYPFAYGWTVSTSGLLDPLAGRAERLDEMRKEGYSEHFIAVMTHAADLGATLVRLDCDAEYEPGLPRFDWENGDDMTLDAALKP
jgi:hypothetical protein